MDEINKVLQGIARGTGIVFAGTTISMLFWFLSMVAIARYFSTVEYGVFNLALTVLSIALVMATIGFQNSLPREIAFYREREPSKVEDLISTALVIVMINSVVMTALLITFANEISLIFHEERLVYALRIIAFALPFSALIGVIISISRGFGRIREQVYFQNVVYHIIFLISILIILFMKLDFYFIFSAYVLAQFFTLLILVFNVQRIKIFKFKLFLNLKLGKKLVTFSLPLMITTYSWSLMTWTDTLMLGYYKDSDVVGLYNAATPLAKFLPILLNSMAFLYIPLTSSLYAQGKIRELARIYQITTKWVFLLAFPLFSATFLFPEVVISFLFGSKYVNAALTLQILSLGFMFHALLGLNERSLITIGETNFIAVASLVSAICNVLLNAILIPIYSINGAALATVASYSIANILSSVRLYQRTKIHPFSKTYSKVLVIGFILLGITWSLPLKVDDIWYMMTILVALLGFYTVLMVISKCIDKEDVELLWLIEKRFNVSLGILRYILMKITDHPSETTDDKLK